MEELKSTYPLIHNKAICYVLASRRERTRCVPSQVEGLHHQG